MAEPTMNDVTPTDPVLQKKKRRKNKKKKNVIQSGQLNYEAGHVQYSMGQPFIQPVGVTGLRYRGGQVQEEYLTEIKSWQKLVKIYIQMRDDVIVGTLLDAIKMPILAAGVHVNPGGDTPGDEAAAGWLEDALHDMHHQTWYSHMEDQLDSIDFGFAIAEIVLDKRDDGRLWIKNLAPRGQETLWKWHFNDEGRATIFVQRDPNSGNMLDIPLNKCVHTIYRGRKGNPQGWALLRSLRRAWRIMSDEENLESIGMEHDIGGMPIAEIGKDVTVNSTDMTTLKDSLKAMRVDEALYAITPSGVSIKPYQGGSKLYDWDRVIQRWQKLILGRMFAQFLKLGMDKVGTQALVKGSQDFFTLALTSVQEYLCEAWNHQLVPYVFTFNTFPGMTALPEIVCNPVGTVDIAGMIDTLAKAVAAKLYTPIDEDEDHIRDALKMPELPDEDRGMPRDPEALPMPEVFNMQNPISDFEIIMDRYEKEITEKLEEMKREMALIK